MGSYYGFDIHGAPLEVGHCEVHPHVHQPYPCELCVGQAAEAQEFQRQQEEAYAAQEAAYWREPIQVELTREQLMNVIGCLHKIKAEHGPGFEQHALDRLEAAADPFPPSQENQSNG